MQQTLANLGSAGPENDLVLGADAPMWVTSTAPLADEVTGQPLSPARLPPSGRADYAFRLHDQQVTMYLPATESLPPLPSLPRPCLTCAPPPYTAILRSGLFEVWALFNTSSRTQDLLISILIEALGSSLFIPHPQISYKLSLLHDTTRGNEIALTLESCCRQQVVMIPNFQHFPDKAITVEFWMRSSDACNYGTPFSYATGNYDEVGAVCRCHLTRAITVEYDVRR